MHYICSRLRPLHIVGGQIRDKTSMLLKNFFSRVQTPNFSELLYPCLTGGKRGCFTHSGFKVAMMKILLGLFRGQGYIQTWSKSSVRVLHKEKKKRKTQTKQI